MPSSAPPSARTVSRWEKRWPCVSRRQRFPIEEIWSFQGPGDGSPISGGHHVDLWKANEWLLEDSGVAAENTRVCGIDTFTSEDFFSARREGVQCGRIINAIRLLS